MIKYQDIYNILDPMPDANELVHGVVSMSREFSYRVAILSAIPKFGRMPMAKIHKRQWLSRRYPYLLDDFNIGPWAQDKYKHCNPGDVLIDDSELNIPQWNAAGGFGILHTSAKDSLSKLRQYLTSSLAD